jgi:hypothetical protein
MRIDSSGRVGIGTSSPTSELDVFHTTDPEIRLTISTHGDAGVLLGDSDGLKIYGKGTNDQLRFYTGTSEAMRIDSSGNLLVGTTSASGFLNSTTETGSISYSDGFTAATASSDSAAYFKRLTDDGAIVTFRNSSAATLGSIKSRSSGGNLQIDTVQSGIDFAGDGWLPMRNGSIVDNDLDIGSSSFRFDDIYATNGTIQTSDANEKQGIEALSEAEQRVAVAAKGLLRKFRWRSAVEEKGDEARIHFGIIAQDLQAAFEAEGLDAGDYAMFIHSTWTDEETGEERSRMGVRYSELLAFIIAAI